MQYSQAIRIKQSGLDSNLSFITSSIPNEMPVSKSSVNARNKKQKFFHYQWVKFS